MSESVSQSVKKGLELGFCELVEFIANSNNPLVIYKYICVILEDKNILLENRIKMRTRNSKMKTKRVVFICSLLLQTSHPPPVICRQIKVKLVCPRPPSPFPLLTLSIYTYIFCMYKFLGFRLEN